MDAASTEQAIEQKPTSATPAKFGKRFEAFFINGLFLGLSAVPFPESPYWPLALYGIALFVLFVFAPECPGKRFCNLALVNDDGTSAGTKARFLRVLPIILLLSIPALHEFIEPFAPLFFGPLMIRTCNLLALLFCINELSVKLDKGNRSFIDKWTKTCVIHKPLSSAPDLNKP